MAFSPWLQADLADTPALLIGGLLVLLGAAAYGYLLLATGVLSRRYYVNIALLLLNAAFGIVFLALLAGPTTLAPAIRIPLGLVAALWTAFALGFGIAELTIFQDSRPRSLFDVSRGAARFTSQVERLRRRTSDGVWIQIVRLVGDRQLLRQGQPRFTGGPRSSAVIVAHGAGRNKDIEGVVATCELLFEDFDVITFDFRGHGESGGRWVGDTTCARDLKVVVDHAKDCGYKKIGLVGWSFGGWVGIVYAAENSGLDAIVAAAPPPGTIGETKLARPLFTWARPWWAFSAFLWYRARHGVMLSVYKDEPSILSYIDKVSPTPLLLAWNELGDSSLGLEAKRFEELYDRAKAPKDRLVLPGAGHVYDWPNTFHYLSAVRQWLKKNL